jgi:hypothetical protein
MPPELVSHDCPPGSVCRSLVSCKPVGWRRHAAWLGNEFLGLAIARVDGMWTSKTPCDETFPGRPDREAALLYLLVPHRATQDDSAFDSSAVSAPLVGQAVASQRNRYPILVCFRHNRDRVFF